MSYDLDELRARVDLEGLVNERTAPARRNGSTVYYHCPNPEHPDRSPSFTVNTSTQRWRCWSACDRSGGAIDLAVWLDGLTVGEAIERLAQRVGLEPTGGTRSPRPTRSTFTPAASPPPPPVKYVTVPVDTAEPVSDDEAAPIITMFLDDRGWSEALLEVVPLSVVRDRSGRYRVRIPFLKGGRPLLWQDRATHPIQEPKYLTPAGAVLYPFHLDSLSRYEGEPETWPACPVLGCPAVWIVEGPTDAMTLLNLWPTMSVIGLPGVGAWSSSYAPLLADLPVVVITDNDDAGRELSRKLAADLEPYCAVIPVDVPEGVNDVSAWYRAYLGEPQMFTDDLIELVHAAADRVAGTAEVMS